MVPVLRTLILLITFSLNDCVEKKTQLRIYNGIRHSQGKYTYIVALVDKYRDYLIRSCTGTLIRREFVLTAGHCLSGRLQYVQYGDMTLPPSSTTMKKPVIEMIRHPNYLKTRKHLWLHDIALVRTAAIDMRIYGELPPTNYLFELGHTVVLAGFGKNSHENTTFDQRNVRPLLTGEGMLIECFNEIKKKILPNVIKHYMCVNPKPFTYIHHIMSGDAGSPLLYNDMVIGVASQFYLKKAVSIYIAVNPQLTWIRQVAFHEPNID